MQPPPSHEKHDSNSAVGYKGSDVVLVRPSVIVLSQVHCLALSSLLWLKRCALRPPHENFELVRPFLILDAMAIDISQSYSKELMLWLGAIFLVFPTCFTTLRLTAKTLGPKGLTLDDYLAVIAWVLNVACCVCLLVAAVDGELGQNQRVNAQGQPILQDPHFLIYEKTKWAVNMLSVLGLGSVKLSILAFYLQIFPMRTFKIIAYGVASLVAIWTISFFFTNLLTCLPVTPLVEPFYDNKCLNSIDMWMASTVSDVVLDFTILLLPIPIVLNLQMRRSQKIAVVSIFLLGGCICVISLVRLLVWFQIAQQFAIHYNDETYFTSPVFFWVVIELGLACICASLPTLRPLWHRIFHRSRHASKYPHRETPEHSENLKLASYSRVKDSTSYCTDPVESGTEVRYTVKVQGNAHVENVEPNVDCDTRQGAGEMVGDGNFAAHLEDHLMEISRTSRVSQSSERI